MLSKQKKKSFIVTSIGLVVFVALLLSFKPVQEQESAAKSKIYRGKMTLHADLIFPDIQGKSKSNAHGSGTVAFIITQGYKLNEGTIALKNIDMIVEPLQLIGDTEKDGKPDQFLSEEFRLTLKEFDVRRCKGPINLKTGEFTMTFALALTPKVPILKKLGLQTIKFDVHEKGKLNFKTGQFKTDAEPIKVTMGPIQMELHADQDGEISEDYPKTAVAVFRSSNQTWYYDQNHNATTDTRVSPWAVRGDLPVAGDFNADRGDLYVDDVAVFRPSNGMWYYDIHHDGDTDGPPIGPWGREGDIPIAGDFNEDGKNDDVGYFRPSDRSWHYDYGHDGGTDATFGPWASPGDIPIVGDFDKDLHIDDVAVYRPSNRMWYYDIDHNGDTDYSRGPWGLSGDIPIAGDFDADGYFNDVAVFRPSDRMWIYDFNHNATSDERHSPWAFRGDIPFACYDF